MIDGWSSNENLSPRVDTTHPSSASETLTWYPNQWLRQLKSGLLDSLVSYSSVWRLVVIGHHGPLSIRIYRPIWLWESIGAPYCASASAPMLARFFRL